MANIILVHGMNATKYSWNKVPKFLEGEGHSVKAVALPGHDGPFPSSGDPKITMADYIAKVYSAFPKGAGKVVLIGHSMGGQVITHVAAKYPDRVERLIYVAAMLPKEGQSANDVRSEANINELRACWQILSLQRKLPKAFGSQPPGPMTKRLKLPSGKSGAKLKAFKAIKRFYVICTKDRILPTAYQAAAVKRAKLKAANIKKIATGHGPQITRPKKLNAALKAFVEAP